MKKKILLIGGGLLTLIIVIVTIFIVNEPGINNKIVMQDNNNPTNNSFLTLMLEQSDGTYQESTTNTWPSGNYAFNSELSRCENGGELSWDREQGIVKLLSNKSDGCYVYFDLYNVVTITNLQATKTTNSVTLTVTVDAGENPVATYYFSIDGGRSYEESTSPNYTFSELTPNTTYTFQVYAKDTLGYESNEEVIEVTTNNYVNPVINSVTATNVSNDSITVNVSASAGTNAIQTYYYSINNGTYTSSGSNSHTFSGLSAGQSYSIKVYVRDTNEVDSNVYNITVTTLSSPIITNATGHFSEIELTIDSISVTSYYSIQSYYVIFKNNSKNLTSNLIEFNEIPYDFMSDYRSSTDDIICVSDDVTAEIYAIDVNGGKSNTIQISITVTGVGAFPWPC